MNWKRTEKNMEWVWVRPLPPFGNFPHIIPFFSDRIPNNLYLKDWEATFELTNCQVADVSKQDFAQCQY